MKEMNGVRHACIVLIDTTGEKTKLGAKGNERGRHLKRVGELARSE